MTSFCCGWYLVFQKSNKKKNNRENTYMNAATARLKGNMKERFKHKSSWPHAQASSVHPKSWGCKKPCCPQGGGEGLNPPYLLKTSQVEKPLFILLSLCSTYTGVNLVFRKREGPSFAPLCPEVYFPGETQRYYSQLPGTPIMLASSWHFRIQTVVCGVYRKFEIPPLLHMQDDQ